MNVLKQYSVLYAEDETIIRMSISKQLETYFKEVLVAKDGKEALKLYEEKLPDVLILDINMPYLSGLEFVHKVRETNKEIPIIMITAYSESNLLLDAVELHLTKYLIKPVSTVVLREALQKVSEVLEELSTSILKLSSLHCWNRETKKLYYRQLLVALTPRERLLLELLAKHYQNCISHESIMAEVWEDKFMEEISIDSIKTLVNGLRKKLPSKAIKSVYGSGYMLS